MIKEERVDGRQEKIQKENSCKWWRILQKGCEERKEERGWGSRMAEKVNENTRLHHSD